MFNAVNRELYATREAAFNDSGNRRKLDYYLKDLGDWARLCGVTARMPPGHPISSVKAMRGACYAQDRECLLPYSEAVFRHLLGR